MGAIGDAKNYNYHQKIEQIRQYLPPSLGINFWYFVSIFCFILLSVLFLWQVSDFGLAREANFNLEGGKFPIKWTAPEAIKQGVGFIIE